MLTILAVLWAVATAHAGSIHIVVEPGDAIFLDGKQIGVSNAADSGFLMEGIAAGNHELAIRTPSGGEVTKSISIVEGQTTTMTISSLGLRTRARGDESAVEMQVTTDAPQCDFAVGSQRVTANAAELKVGHLRAGRFDVALSCGNKRAAGTVDLPPGKIVTMQADLATGKIKTVDERPRVTAVHVPTIEDAIMRLDLPFLWKRAIAASLVAGVKPTSIARNGTLTVKMVLTGPSYSTMQEVASNLSQRSEVQAIATTGWGYSRTDNSLQMGYLITFRSGE